MKYTFTTHSNVVNIPVNNGDLALLSKTAVFADKKLKTIQDKGEVCLVTEIIGDMCKIWVPSICVECIYPVFHVSMKSLVRCEIGEILSLTNS